MKNNYLIAIFGLFLSVTANSSELSELKDLSAVRHVDPRTFDVLMDLKIEAAESCSKTVEVKELLISVAFNEAIDRIAVVANKDDSYWDAIKKVCH